MGYMRLKYLRKSRGLSQQKVADGIGVDVGHYNRMENEKRDITMKWLGKLADFYNCEVPDLFASRKHETIGTKSIILVKVVGAAQARYWVEEIGWPESEQYSVMVPDFDKLPPNAFALELRGPSMNAVYPDGTVAICIPINDYDREIGADDHVIVESRNAAGLVEVTCKEVRIDEHGAMWLWPRSDHPDFQQPVAADRGTGDVRITAIVHASYQPRPKKLAK